MKNIAVLGVTFGDEGKGRVVHDFSPNYDWVIRVSGGANCGHTIYRDGKKYVHNLLPSFDWRSQRPKAFLASGMVIDLEQLHKELSALADIDPILPQRVYIDPDAFLVVDAHKEQDRATNAHIGTTNRGIGPAYKDKIARQGLRIRDVMEQSGNKYNSLVNKIKSIGANFVGFVELYSHFEKSSLLFEGAQGIMIDINHGTYPYVTCGQATAAAIYSAGFNFKLDHVYGVGKAYTTRVGEGPFPTELIGGDETKLREIGKEFGATTGRPRRVGWLDIPAMDYACKVGGVTDLIITKFDILNNYGTIKVCEKYKRAPTSPGDFNTAEPVYTELQAWSDAKDLPQLKQIIKMIEKGTNKKVAYISYGVNKEDLIQTNGQLNLNI